MVSPDSTLACMGESTDRGGPDVEPNMPIKFYPVVLFMALSVVLSILRGGIVGVLFAASWLVSGGQTTSIRMYLYGTGLFFLVIIPVAMVPIVLLLGRDWMEAGRTVLPTLACSAYLVWVTTRSDVHKYGAPDVKVGQVSLGRGGQSPPSFIIARAISGL